LIIKKGYIILIVLAALIYGYFSYQSTNTNKKYTNIIINYLTDIRHQDYFAIHSKLATKTKKTVSVDDIKNFCQKIKINKFDKFDLKDVAINNNQIKISGFIISNGQKIELHSAFIEQNNTLKLISQTIGKIKLTPKTFAFPIK